MRYLDIIRGKITEKEAERASAIDEMEAATAAAVEEERATLTTEEDAAYAAAKERADVADAELSELRAREAELAKLDEQTQRQADAGPTILRRVERDDTLDVVRASRSEARDQAMVRLEDRDVTRNLRDAARDRVAELIDTQTDECDGSWVARRLITTETAEYRSAFRKAMTSTAPAFTSEEARAVERAMSIGTDAAGGYGVPVTIDPTIVLTAQGSLNPMRRIARVIPITNDVWKGVSSTGVSWSYDAEAAAVSDDSPTLAQPSVTAHMARGFIPFSIEVGGGAGAGSGDYPGFAAEMSRLLGEGYDELQASVHATGTGSDQPFGILTALDANTNVEVTPTTDGAFGAVDINKVWGALPDRYKANATWVMNHDVGNEVSSFSSSGTGSFFTVDLSQGNAPQLKGRPVEFATNFPDFTGTTAAANILVVGDFRNYVIVDRLGMNVELVPHLFDVTDNRPTGQRGWFAYARSGADSINDLGFRLLQNQ